MTMPRRGVHMARGGGQHMAMSGRGGIMFENGQKSRTDGRGEILLGRGAQMMRGHISGRGTQKTKEGHMMSGGNVQMTGQGQMISGAGVQFKRGGGQMISGRGGQMTRGGGQIMSEGGFQMTRGGGQMISGRGGQMTRGGGQMISGIGGQMTRGGGKIMSEGGFQMTRGNRELILNRGVQIPRGRGRDVQMTRERGRDVQMTRGRGRNVQMTRGNGEIMSDGGVHMPRGGRGRKWKMSEGNVEMTRGRGHMIPRPGRDIQRDRGQIRLGMGVPMGDVGRQVMQRNGVPMARGRGQKEMTCNSIPIRRGNTCGRGVQMVGGKDQIVSERSVPMANGRGYPTFERPMFPDSDVQISRGTGYVMPGSGDVISEETEDVTNLGVVENSRNLQGFSSKHGFDDTIDLSDSSEEDNSDSFSPIEVAQKVSKNISFQWNGNMEFEEGRDSNFNVASNYRGTGASDLENNEEDFSLDSAEFIIEMDQAPYTTEGEVILVEAQEDLGNHNEIPREDLITMEEEIVLIESHKDLGENDMTSQDASNSNENQEILCEASENLEKNVVNSRNDSICLICIESDDEDGESSEFTASKNMTANEWFRNKNKLNLKVDVKEISGVETKCVDKVNVESEAKISQKGKDSQSSSFEKMSLPKKNKDTDSSSFDKMPSPKKKRDSESSSFDKMSLPKNSSVSRKNIKRLNQALSKCATKIKELDETVIDWEDEATYKMIFRYKKRYMQIHQKIAQIENNSADVGRKSDQPFRFNESKHSQINRKIEKFINETKIFPDFKSFHSLLKKTNEKSNLQLTEAQVSSEAESMFQKVGGKLKSRRKADEDDVLNAYMVRCDATDGEDPADKDEELEEKLKDNSLLGNRNYDQVMQELQEKKHAQPESVALDEENDEESEDTEGGDESEQEDDDVDIGMRMNRDKLTSVRNEMTDEEDSTIWDMSSGGESELDISNEFNEINGDEISDEENEESKNT